ncbi:MAG: RNA polymerase-binding protein DksA [Gammaproteobacteria bacterium]
MMPASKSSKKKSPAAKSGSAGKAAAPRKAPASKTAAAKKTAAKKAPARKPTVKKPPAKKAPAKKAPAAKKAAVKKTPAKKPAAKKAVAKKPVAKKAAATKAPAKPVAAKKPAAPKAPAKKASATKKSLLVKKKPLAIKPEQPEPSFGFSGPLKAFKPYQPAPREEYMSDAMREHFRKILVTWQQELMEEVDRTVHHMKDEAANFPDPNDRATQESEFGLELRTRDRERKLLKKIEQALGRIEDGSYGFCSETGEEIGLRRLEARPVATLTVEAQERRELAEKQYRDRDDR